MGKRLIQEKAKGKKRVRKVKQRGRGGGKKAREEVCHELRVGIKITLLYVSCSEHRRERRREGRRERSERRAGRMREGKDRGITDGKE